MFRFLRIDFARIDVNASDVVIKPPMVPSHAKVHVVIQNRVGLATAHERGAVDVCAREECRWSSGGVRRESNENQPHQCTFAIPRWAEQKTCVFDWSARQ